ncbi:MAG: hypothetical protein II185_00565, partial [Firmicutes bacterium]|nr:hypothetical protein [Bacillota bacterium]
MRSDKKKKKKVRIKWGRFILSLFVVCAVVLAGLLFWPLPSKPAENEVPVNNTAEPDPPKVQTEFPLRIRCVGDIMTHGRNIVGAEQGDGTYDFSDNYVYVDKYLKDADV